MLTLHRVEHIALYLIGGVAAVFLNYDARTRLIAKSLLSVQRLKCRANENEPKFLEIQWGE